MHFHVLESVLFDVPDSKIRVFLDPSGLGDEFTSEELDESRLSSTVATNYGGAG